MASGDIQTFVLTVDDDGTKADTALTGQSIATTDTLAMCSLPGNKVFVLVLKS